MPTKHNRSGPMSFGRMRSGLLVSGDHLKVQSLTWKKSIGQLGGIIKQIAFSYDLEKQEGGYGSNQRRERRPRKHKRSSL